MLLFAQLRYQTNNKVRNFSENVLNLSLVATGVKLLLRIVVMRSSLRWTVFLIFTALLCFLQCDTKHTGITNSTPKLQSPRLNIRGISLLTVSAGLLMRPKRSLAFSPVVSTAVTTNAASVISSSVVVAVKDEESIVNGLISGAATRVSKELLLHPIDTVRARLQRAPNYVEQNDGLFDNLYDGLLPALIGGVPAGALFFGIKDYSKKKLRRMGLGKQESTVLSVMAANVPYWLIRTPSEVLKTRRQIGYDNSSSIGEMMDKMVEVEGGIMPAIQFTYGSYASNFVYALPADIIKFVACKYIRIYLVYILTQCRCFLTQ